MKKTKNNAVEKVENISKRVSDSKLSELSEKEKEVAKERIELAKVKEQNKMEKAKQKAEQKKQKQENKENNKRGIRKNGFIATIIVLGISTLALASALTFTLLMPSANDTSLEATYQKSFYDTIEQVDNIDLNLSKVLATKDTKCVQNYLMTIAINSELAENDLQQLPIQDENKFYTTKLINQIGDYAKYLNKKLINQESLSEDDYKNLLVLYESNRAFKESLQKMTSEMGVDFSFSSLSEGGRGNVVISNLNELQNLSVEYPELIYDGPFSDGINEREIKGLFGEEITEKTAQDIFKKIFGSFGLDSVKSSGETNSTINCYNVEGKVKGDTLYAQISKKGGKLIMMSLGGDCNNVNINSSQAIEVAKSFLDIVGIGEMEAVWTNLANNLYTINFAYKQNGIIVYSDLIKIRVCAETATVIGFEASSYYTNHIDRVVESAVLTSDNAQENVSNNIEILTSRLVIIPVGTSSEKLCYEFSGTYDGQTYYVYIDAITGRQVEMFKVIESTEGTLLM